MLKPGGCAGYILPVTTEQKYVMIRPARKSDPEENYYPNAKVDVVVSTNGLQTNFSCFPDPEDCHYCACVGNFQSLLTEDISEVEMSLCTQEEANITASIWEIDITEVSHGYSLKIIILILFFSPMTPVRSRGSSWKGRGRDFN